MSDFDNLLVRKISNNKFLRVRIIRVSQTFHSSGPVCWWNKILLAKLCKWTKRLPSSPGVTYNFSVFFTDYQPGFEPGFGKWASKMRYRASSNEQFIRQRMKNKTIFFERLAANLQLKHCTWQVTTELTWSASLRMLSCSTLSLLLLASIRSSPA